MILQTTVSRDVSKPMLGWPDPTNLSHYQKTQFLSFSDAAPQFEEFSMSEPSFLPTFPKINEDPPGPIGCIIIIQQFASRMWKASRRNKDSMTAGIPPYLPGCFARQPREPTCQNRRRD